jgi:hypothetical protein
VKRGTFQGASFTPHPKPTHTTIFLTSLLFPDRVFGDSRITVTCKIGFAFRLKIFRAQTTWPLLALTLRIRCPVASESTSTLNTTHFNFKHFYGCLCPLYTAYIFDLTSIFRLCTLYNIERKLFRLYPLKIFS